MLVRLFLILVFPFFLQSLAAQKTTLQFRHLTMENGLADGWVHDMIMDSKGMVWFATHDGLSRYDGYHFKNYQGREGEKNSLEGPVTMGIREGKDGIYWLASNGVGLIRFDSKKEAFTSFRSQPNDSTSMSHLAATTIFVDNEGEVWVGTFGGGFNHFHEKTGTFTRYSLPDTAYAAGQDFMLNSVRHIVADPLRADKFWIVSHQGIYHFNKKTGAKIHYPLMSNGGPAFGVSILADTSGMLWVGTENCGLVQMDSRTGETTFIPGPMQVKNVYRKSKTELWAATIGEGLGIYNLESKTWIFVREEASKLYGILSNEIYGVYVDRENRLWVRDMHLGVSVSSGKAALFKKAEMPEHVSLNLYGQKQFSFDSIHKLLFVASAKTNQFYVFEKNASGYFFSRTVQLVENQEIETATILKLYSDSKGRTYILVKINQAIKLFEYGRAFGTVEEIPLAELKELDANIDFATMEEDKNGTLWVAFSDGTLLGLHDGKVDKKRLGKGFPKGKSPQIWSIRFDSKNELWACSLSDGLLRYDCITDKEMHYACDTAGGLDAWRILAVAEAKNGKIWVGASAAGIQVLDPALPVKQKMLSYNQHNGLPDDKISSISVDSMGTIWIATNRGLTRYKPETEQFKSYGSVDGLENTFLQFGTEQISNGDIMLGATQGFQYIQPASTIDGTAPRKVFFSKLWVNGIDFKTDSLFELCEKIELGPEENYFTVFFSARYYDNPDQILYRYKLEGYDRDWTTLQAGIAEAKFTNVPPGTYTFKVLASNSDGQWNTLASSLTIQIHTHWFWSSFMQSIYIVLLASGIWSYVQVRRRRRRLQQQLEIEKVELENSRQLEQLKSEMLAQSEQLLLNILPEDVAQELKEKGKVEPRQLAQSTVLFLDFKGFTLLCKTLTANELIETLSTLFGGFDRIVSKHQLERIKTIGDAYMAFGGMAEEGEHQAIAMVEAALEMQQFLSEWNSENPQLPKFEARCGIHAGPITAGVVGQQKFAFDIWGETVNIASRMESFGLPNHINISASFYSLIGDYFVCEKREVLDVKGLGLVEMYFVRGKK